MADLLIGGDIDPSTHQRVQVALLYLDSTVAARGPRP